MRAGSAANAATPDEAKAQGTGWVDYRMTDSVSHKVGLKKSWVIGMGGDDVLFVGAFGS
jgi:hypothetical protein